MPIKRNAKEDIQMYKENNAISGNSEVLIILEKQKTFWKNKDNRCYKV